MNLDTLRKFSIGPIWTNFSVKFVLPKDEEYNYSIIPGTGLYRPYYRDEENVYCFETDDCFFVSFETEKEVLDFLNYARLKFL